MTTEENNRISDLLSLIEQKQEQNSHLLSDIEANNDFISKKQQELNEYLEEKL